MGQKELANMTLELRRGILALAFLSQLQEQSYGYNLIKQLGDQGLEIDQGTLYPLLRRLEANGLLDSEWRVDGSRPRRYYRTNEAGLKVLEQLQGEWASLVNAMKGILS
jgi:PadR family transcriptional regulator PadR